MGVMAALAVTDELGLERARGLSVMPQDAGSRLLPGGGSGS